MSDLKTQVLEQLHYGQWAEEIAVQLKCQPLDVRRALLELKADGKVYRGVSLRWYRATSGGYNPPENVA